MLEAGEQCSDQLKIIKRYFIDKQYIGIVKLDSGFVYVNTPHKTNSNENQIICMYSKRQ